MFYNNRRQVFICILLLLDLLLLATSHIQHLNHFFATNEDKVIVGAAPFLTFNTSSQVECLLKCKQTSGCHSAQVELSKWLCSLFNTSYRELRSKGSATVYVLEPFPTDCLYWRAIVGSTVDGIYEIKVNGIKKKVFCDMTTDGGGWTVFQQRFDGSVSFNRDWNDFRNGFGDADNEYWLGNEFVHILTKDTTTRIRIEGETYDGQQLSTTFEGFSLEDENNYYKLHSGTVVGDNRSFEIDWQWHDLARFSTGDADGGTDCPEVFMSGWWFKLCFFMNLNGKYHASGSGSHAHCVCAKTNPSFGDSMIKTRMMIRKK